MIERETLKDIVRMDYGRGSSETAHNLVEKDMSKSIALFSNLVNESNIPGRYRRLLAQFREYRNERISVVGVPSYMGEDNIMVGTVSDGERYRVCIFLSHEFHVNFTSPNFSVVSKAHKEVARAIGDAVEECNILEYEGRHFMSDADTLGFISRTSQS